MAVAPPPTRRTPTALRVLAVPLTAAVLVIGAVLARLVHLPDRTLVELRGLRRLELVS